MPAVQPAPAAAPGAAPTMQRRHSSASSSDAGSDQGLHSRHTSQENIALIPTRTTKVATSKPAANPLQFVKVGPCDLSRHAQEQLKKVDLVKKAKPEKRDETEDWQSNLDNWKVSRRKRQEHIIERVVEVKKLELEEHDRNRRRSKTFNEMLEERTIKGRKTSLPVYQDDDNDLSELGLSTAKTNGEDNVFHDGKDEVSSNDDISSACSSGGNTTALNGHSQRSQREPSSEQEEYTYERAIQNYVNFTESRVRGRSLTPSDSDHSALTNGLLKKSSPPVPTKPRRGSCKIEEKLSELEQIKKKSMSTNDLTENSRKPLSVPKVDILKRREMFEKSYDEETSNVKNRLSGDFGSSKSIRDRVSSFGKPSDDLQSVKKNNRISAEISVKDRLFNIEKQNSVDSVQTKSNSMPNSNIAISHSVKDRLSSLQKTLPVEPSQINPQSQTTVEKIKVKEKGSIKSSVKGNVSAGKTTSNYINSITQNGTNIEKTEDSKLNGIQKEEIVNEEEREKSTLSPTEDLYETKRQQHYRHRSLDSLDVDSTDGVGNESFERVQSLEDLEFCRNYPASSVSGDTDREDSGIHTADVSSSVSQADDCDLHLDGEFHQQPTILEEINKNPELTSTLIVKQINQINVSDSVFENSVEVLPVPEVGDNSCSFLKLPLKLDCDPLPVILESPSEPFPPTDLSKTHTYPPCESSHYVLPSLSNVTSTTNADGDSNSPIKSEIVNINSKLSTEQCTLIPRPCENRPSASNSPVYTTLSLSTLPLQLSSTEILHDNNSGAMEICHKIEVSESSTAVPLPNPMVSVEAEYKSDPEEKFEDSLEYKVEGVHHLSELTVDVSKPESVCPLLPVDSTPSPALTLPIFSDIDTSKLLGGIEGVFPLSPSTMEPPKEKPPPPPTEISDDDDNINNKSVSLRRLDSTKRIKKEIRQKRSSFLGIEDSNADNYLEPELELVRRPPDISSFLAEEKRLEQLLYRQSICSESESRDSGVELEKHHDDLTWSTVHHSRDNSETYGNTSTTSEEEEIVKKEREIIEMLEREEINRYPSGGQDQDNIGEKLAERLRELEAEKSRLEWEREEELSRRKAEEAVRAEQQTRIQARELELCKQENTQEVQDVDIHTELLIAERERLEAEQASLARQRDLILQQQHYNHNRSLTDVRVVEAAVPSYVVNSDYRRSMQDLRATESAVTCYRRPVEPPPGSMPDLATQPCRPPPPIPPAKPLIIPRTQDKRISSPQQMSRQTLQALSAAPKPRLSDNWLQSKRKTKPTQDNYNYQHWLIQEAEQRRITEHHQRQAPPPRRPVPPPPQQSSGWGGNNNNVQYTNWQPANAGGQWGPAPTSQPRSDKPLPDSIIQTLTQRVQNRLHSADPNNNRRRTEQSTVIDTRTHLTPSESQEKMLSVSGKKKCSHCGEELGRGAAMIIESLRLFYHIDCFKCCVCCVQLGDGLMGTDVRVRNNKLHCHNCYSSDDGVKFSCV